MRRQAPIALTAALLVLVVPRSADAGNGTHPRTPVVWTDTACLTVIDRGQSPIHALDYDIPFEDVDVTPDEVVNSRTHQFFAFCRQHHSEEILPGWINASEVDEATMSGLAPLGGDPVDLEYDVLTNNPEWAGCWARINGDDERRPITFAAAAEPVMWDTTELPAGTYVVEGYTYEPWFNAWWPRPGVFKIVDDPDPSLSPPAAAITHGEQLVELGDQAIVSGCVDAAPGATMTVSWARSGFGQEPDWQTIAADVPVTNGGFEVPFNPPIEAVNYSLMTRVDVVDPSQRSWTAYSLAYISVVETSGDETDGCEDGGFVVNPCDTEGGSEGTGSEGTDEVGSESGEGPALDEGGSSGCGCTSTTPGTGWTGALVLLGLAAVRRRSRSDE